MEDMKQLDWSWNGITEKESGKTTSVLQSQRDNLLVSRILLDNLLSSRSLLDNLLSSRILLDNLFFFQDLAR